MKRHLYPALFALIFTLTILGCTTTKLVETPPGSGKYEEVAEVDPKLSAALEALGALNTTSAPFNPFSGGVAIVLTSIASFATWFARRRTAQLRATIIGVEAKGGEDVKAAIKAAAMSAGIQDSLHKAVKSVTA